MSSSAPQRLNSRHFSRTAQAPQDEFGGYFNFSKDGHGVAGGMGNDGSTGSPDTWTIYLASEDNTATAAAVAAHGGMTYVEPMDVMDLGNMAVFADPAGSAIGSWRPGVHTGFEIIAEPGAPSWFELHTNDYDKVLDFYRGAFGWSTSVAIDEPTFRYTTLGEGEDQAAGVMDVSMLPAADFPTGWSVYFNVVDTDVSIARAIELGGTLVHGPDDSPHGRLATIADPTGVRFRLQGPNA